MSNLKLDKMVNFYFPNEIYTKKTIMYNENNLNDLNFPIFYNFSDPINANCKI